MKDEIVAGSVARTPEFFYTDDNNTKYAVMDFLACEGNDGHKFLLLFVPVSLYERQKTLFTPGKKVYVRGEMDAIKPLIKIHDAYTIPAGVVV